MLTHLELVELSLVPPALSLTRTHYALTDGLWLDGSQGQDVDGVSALTLASQMLRLSAPIVSIANRAVT